MWLLCEVWFFSSGILLIGASSQNLMAGIGGGAAVRQHPFSPHL
jgi:hypothetical protein